MASGVKGVTLNTDELTVSGDYAHERGTGVLKIQQHGETPTKQNIKYIVYGNARRMAGKTCGTSGIAPLEVYQRSVSGVDMSKTIIIIDSSEVNEGKLEDLKTSMNELVEFAKMNEPNMIAYDVYFNEDGTQMTVLQVHPDSASAEFHMKISGSRFSRFVEFVKMSGIDIYG